MFVHTSLFTHRFERARFSVVFNLKKKRKMKKENECDLY